MWEIDTGVPARAIWGAYCFIALGLQPPPPPPPHPTVVFTVVSSSPLPPLRQYWQVLYWAFWGVYDGFSYHRRARVVLAVRRLQSHQLFDSICMGWCVGGRGVTCGLVWRGAMYAKEQLQCRDRR